MPAFNYQQPSQPGQRQQPGPPPGYAPGMPPGPRPGLVPRARRTGSAEWSYRWSRIQRNIVDGPWRSLGIIISNALGVAISIAIIASAEGIHDKINSLMAKCLNGSINCSGAGIDVNAISNVLKDTEGVLTNLAIVSTAAIVGLVTWITISQRRRAISLEVQAGQRRRDLIVEFLGEAMVLCVAGGVVGVILGYILCSLIGGAIPLLPMNPQLGNIFSIFPVTTLLAFATTAGISAYFAANTDTRAKL